MSNGHIKILFFVTLISCLNTDSFCQKLIKIDLSNACSFDGCGYVDSEDVYSFTASNKANTVINNILAKIGLKPNFIIKAGSVENALATFLNDGTKIIFYNEDYMKNIDLDTKNNWASTFILAHEMGHHLNADNLSHLEGRPGNELIADEFAAFVLYKLGANLEETKSAVNSIKAAEGCTTHPPKQARLQAATVGWTKAQEENEGKKECEKKNLGDYCFLNKTPQEIYVFLCDKESFTFQQYGCVGYGANVGGSNRSVTVPAGEKRCFSQYEAKSWGYTIQTISINEHLAVHDQNRKKIQTVGSGEILIEKCKSETMEVK